MLRMITVVMSERLYDIVDLNHVEAKNENMPLAGGSPPLESHVFHDKFVFSAMLTENSVAVLFFVRV